MCIFLNYGVRKVYEGLRCVCVRERVIAREGNCSSTLREHHPAVMVMIQADIMVPSTKWNRMRLALLWMLGT